VYEEVAMNKVELREELNEFYNSAVEKASLASQMIHEELYYLEMRIHERSEMTQESVDDLKNRYYADVDAIISETIESE
jgi:hypothetical protein